MLHRRIGAHVRSSLTEMFLTILNTGLIARIAIVIVSLYILSSVGVLLAADVTLRWDSNTELTLAGYKIYFGGESRSYGTSVDVGNVTTHTLQGLGPGTYYFAATAYDILGNESGFSNEVSRTISGPPCASISPTTQSFAASAGTGSVSVTSATHCSWTAASNADWLSITSGAGGVGNGTVNYSVAANPNSASRTGTLTIANQTFAISQAAIATPPPTCDINRDAAINVLDLQRLANIILGTPGTGCYGGCDINRDGRIDVLDLQVLANVILGISGCP